MSDDGSLGTEGPHDASLKERIQNEMVVEFEEPDPDRLVDSVSGIIGISPGTHRPEPLYRFRELTPGHKVLAYLLAAWAASKIGDVSGTVEETALLELDGVDESVLGGLLGDGWIERHHGHVWLRPTALVDVVDRMEEYQDG